MGDLLVKGEFNFNNYATPEIVDYKNCKMPLFHGTRKYALEVSEEKRQEFYNACREVAIFAKDLIDTEKIAFNTVVFMFNKSAKYEYGDFYLTPTYTCAISFSYQAGGELGKNVYSVCKDIINNNIEVPPTIKEKIDLIVNEFIKYEKSEKVVLVYVGIKFEDLYTATGRKFINSLELDEYEKEDVEELYKEKETQTYCKNLSLRIKNPKNYEAYSIDELNFRKGFKAFTEITDIDKYIKRHNSYVATKWDF